MKHRARFRQEDLIFVAGPRGSGKSEIVKEIARAMPRLVVIDTMHEYDFERDHFDFFPVRTPPEFGAIASQIAKHRPDRFRILYQGAPERDDVADFNVLMEILFWMGDAHVVIEELPQYCSSSLIPHWLKKQVTIGRHRGIGITATAQRPAMVHKDFISGCRHKIVARFSEANDLKYLEKTIGKSLIDSMQYLKPHDFIHVEEGHRPRITRAH